MRTTKERSKSIRKPEKNAPKHPAKLKKSRKLDKELDDSFPASDPPSITQPKPDKD